MGVRHFLLCLTAACVTILPVTKVYGGDWSLTATATENLEFNDNIEQAIDSSGNTYGSTTNLTTDLALLSPTLTMNFLTDLDFRRYAGPGGDDSLDTFNQNYEAGLIKKFESLEFNLSGVFGIQSTTFSEVESLGVLNPALITEDSRRLSFSTDTGVNYEINSRLSATLSGELQYVDFTDGSSVLSPFLDIGISGSLIRKLSERANLSLSGNVNRFSTRGTNRTTSDTFALDTELSYRFSPRFSTRTSIGASLVNTETNSTSGTASSSSSLVGSYDIEVDYQPTQTTQLSFGMSQSTEPSSLGELQLLSRVFAGIDHTINSRTSVSLSVSAGSVSPLSGDSDDATLFLSVSPSYSNQLSRLWQFSAGYDFSIQDQSAGNSFSNRVFVSMSRQLTIQP